MDKIKKALRLGDPVYKHDDDFDAAIQRMRIEQEQEMKRIEYDRQRQMMNAQQERYSYGWNDPRGRAIPSRIPSVEELYENVKRANSLSKDLMHKIERTEKKVEMLTGFYTWITEVYPEIAAQHKAMRELYEAANSNENQTEAGP
jgi:hypothetical protein